MELTENLNSYQPRTAWMAKEDPVVQWLLQGDPAIRWQVLRDLTNASETEVNTERARELLRAYPSMPATVIAERIGWDRGLTVLKDRVREHPLVVLAGGRPAGLDRTSADPPAPARLLRSSSRKVVPPTRIDACEASSLIWKQRAQ